MRNWSGTTHSSDAEGEAKTRLFTDSNGKATVGFCLWCNRDFYFREEVWAHNADDMKVYPVFQELKDEDCGAPVLYHMLQDAELLDEPGPQNYAATLLCHPIQSNTPDPFGQRACRHPRFPRIRHP
jgi:hypothetical protein